MAVSKGKREGWFSGLAGLAGLAGYLCTGFMGKTILSQLAVWRKSNLD
ncbi:MAG: hypothetical protein RBS68_04165 [Anaerolineales bacterium]|nr:hypothetical protein [Anaerolineales bacterium]